MSKTYHASHYAHIHDVEAHHFWFVARNEMIRDMVRRFIPRGARTRFLDVGCGTGIVLEVLDRLGMKTTGLDVNARALLYAAQKTKSPLVRSSIFRYRPRQRFSAVGAFDVMEHIPNDVEFLSHCRALMVNGGFLFLTVPASPRLWSSIDAASGHQRRYTPEDMRDKLLRNGFRIAYMGYWNSLLLPVYMLWRRVEGADNPDIIQRYLKKPHYIMNRLLLMVLRLERIIGWGRLPGATLVAVAQKV